MVATMVSCNIIIFYILSLTVSRSFAMMTSSPGALSVLPAPFHAWNLQSQHFTNFGAKIQNTTWSRRPPFTPLKIHPQQPKIHHQITEIHHQKPRIHELKVEARRRYNNYKDHYYQPKNVMACIPKVERLCKNVFRAVKVVRDVQRCFDVPSVECPGPEKMPSSSMVCSTDYEMDQKLSTATVARFKRDSQCTKLRSKNYQATFCYFLPMVDRKEVGATLVFPASREQCEDLSIDDPGNNCRVQMKTKCIIEPQVHTEMKAFMECEISQEKAACTQLPPLSIDIPK